MTAAEYNKTVYEYELQMQLIEYINLQYPGTLYHHSPNEGKRSAVSGKILNGMGMRKGFPDLEILEPKGDIHGLFIELKRDNDSKVSDDQKTWLQELYKRGYAAFACRGFDEAKHVIDQYMRLGNG